MVSRRVGWRIVGLTPEDRSGDARTGDPLLDRVQPPPFLEPDGLIHE